MEEAGEPLLRLKGENSPTKWTAFVEELRSVGGIAMPMVLVLVSQYLLRAVTMMMLGHLGELVLAGASLATSLSNVTGFSLIVGMASALETLCGQAYGAGRYEKVGIYTTGSIIWLLVACLPVSLLWVYTEKLLIFLGQDPLISKEAGDFSLWLIPSLFPYSILQALVRYLQIQSLITPMVISTVLTLIIHVPLSWAFIFKFNLGNAGAALSIGLSYWLNVIMLSIYVKYSEACKKTRAPFSNEVFLTAREFFHLAIPSTLMLCLEWWTYEIVILLSGILPNPELETSVLSICLTIVTIHFLVPYSISAAASTRVSNELGAGKPEKAQAVLLAVIALSLAELVVASGVFFCCRYILGYAFSNEKDVVSYVKDMVPLICFSVVMDGLQAVFSGIARGGGKQRIGAYVNLGAYYIVGLPVAILLGFILNLKGRGLWGGLVAGSTFQSLMLGIVAFCTDWRKQAIEARKRVMDVKTDAADQLF